MSLPSCCSAAATAFWASRAIRPTGIWVADKYVKEYRVLRFLGLKVEIVPDEWPNGGQ
jgi:hypothetical protein